MSKAEQLLEDLAYLERVGMTLEQLRSLHHWTGRHTEANVTYTTVRNYFRHDRDMQEKNLAFADRLHLVADLHRRGIAAIVEIALRTYPLSPAA